MKIYTQDRRGVRTMPTEIHIADSEGVWRIEGRSCYNDSFGTYQTEGRAKEVLHDMFQYLRSGKKTYIMPEK